MLLQPCSLGKDHLTCSHLNLTSNSKKQVRKPTVTCLRLGFEDIAQIAQNKVLIAATISAAIGQVSKPFTSAILYGSPIDFKVAIQAGGFPSTHSSLKIKLMFHCLQPYGRLIPYFKCRLWHFPFQLCVLGLTDPSALFVSYLAHYTVITLSSLATVSTILVFAASRVSAVSNPPITTPASMTIIPLLLPSLGGSQFRARLVLKLLKQQL
ncbi:Protein of unknown function DUF212 [Dillenia turbinata]|uniref:Uncharacterized protein n=1 Tax=Dillenia turbinata TaxID=194707 RepID=A0AAN8VS80_9MAGN